MTAVAADGSPENAQKRPDVPAWPGYILVTNSARSRSILTAVSTTWEQGEEAPTSELLSGAVGDRCANCQAPLASDQRYCVNCGSRRGKPRFTPDTVVTHTSSAPAAGAVDGPPPPHRPRASAATTLVAGVATLLIAMGVGVLIGHNSNNAPARVASPQVITVGGGLAAAGGNTASNAGTPSTAAAKKGAKLKVKTTVVHLSPKTAKAASVAAAKVLGGSAPSNPTVQQGQSCSPGTAGCDSTGHFTGSFFGGN